MKLKNEALDKLRGKKVLMVGLGILGGGVATARFLVKRGAKLTITDLKDEDYLKKSLKKLKGLKITYVLGKHNESDFKESELIVLNPDVPVDSPFVKIAKKYKVPITNELNLFMEYCKSKNIVAITGTRGKTTTVAWTHFLMNELVGKTHLAGNSPTNPFLKMVDKIKENDFVVCECPSYQLEIVDKSFKPKVSVITNIYRDHINRHKTEENYAKIKSNIFKYQSKDDFLILNNKDKWTKEFLNKKIKPEVLLVPNKKILPKLPADFGEHNEQNLNIALLIINLFKKEIWVTGLKSKMMISDELIRNLPQPTFRQEKVFESKDLTVINDSAATSPEATIAALNRFRGLGTFLITGGTDRGLHYKELAKFLNKNIKNENLALLAGSATEKLKEDLSHTVIPVKTGIQASKNIFNEFDSLKECIEFVKKQIAESEKKEERSFIVFSPGAKSFEKFKNEFDRGEKFNTLFKKIFKKL